MLMWSLSVYLHGARLQIIVILSSLCFSTTKAAHVNSRKICRIMSFYQGGQQTGLTNGSQDLTDCYKAIHLVAVIQILSMGWEKINTFQMTNSHLRVIATTGVSHQEKGKKATTRANRSLSCSKKRTSFRDRNMGYVTKVPFGQAWNGCICSDSFLSRTRESILYFRKASNSICQISTVGIM